MSVIIDECECTVHKQLVLMSMLGVLGPVGDNGAHPHSLVMHHVVIIIVEGAADVGCCLWGGMLMSPVRAYVRIGEGIIQAIWAFGATGCQKPLKRNI